ARHGDADGMTDRVGAGWGTEARSSWRGLKMRAFSCRSNLRRASVQQDRPRWSRRAVHLPPVLIHAIHDREYEGRRPADQQDTGEAFDPRQHPPARPDDDVAESDRRVGGEGEIERRLQVRQLLRVPENDRPEADLDQM